MSDGYYQRHRTSRLTIPRADEMSQLIVMDDGVLQPPTRPIQPSMTARQYSAHVYALNMRNPQDLEHEVREPEQAHMSRRDSAKWPLQSIVTIGTNRDYLRPPPRAPLRRNASDISIASSGISVKEWEVPDHIFENLEARGPGTYRCTVTSIEDRKGTSMESFDGQLDKTTTVKYHLEAVDTYEDRIAGKELLQYLLTTYPLPPALGPPWWNWFWYDFFSTYRRLHTFVLIANIIAFGIMVSRSAQQPDSFSYTGANAAVAANLFATTLARHEHCINLLFRICTSLPHWIPLGTRRHAAKVYSYGGIHSACGLSAVMWYAYFVALFLNQFELGSDAELHALGALMALMLFLFIIVTTMAHPWMRRNFHDQWEISHRFSGWTAISVIWAQTIVIAHATARMVHRSMARTLAETPAFWFLCAITCLIVYPWARVRRRTFDAEVLSSHAVRLDFHHHRRMSTCKAIRLSDKPLLENHGFATIPNPDGEKGYSALVSNAGDWTQKIINNPPKHLWVKGAPTMGVSRVTLLFKRVVVVATGSGIGPCMSFHQVHPEWPCRIIWSARFPEATYGKELMTSVFRADKNAVVIDTRKTGRPDMVGLTYAAYREINAEAVIIISNPKITKEVTYAMESRNIPAYGAIFDS